MGKTGRKNKKYSPEFKIHVIMDMREHHLGYNETMRKYFPQLIKQCPMSESTFYRRLREYRAEIK